MEISINGKYQLCLSRTTTAELSRFLQQELGLEPKEYYLLSNGKIVNDRNDFEYNKVDVVPRLFGGKGGFGSMLRAIGAQIEKTTNREACRDLSGRRLRDINEEQRLKNWINQQAEREKETKERRQKKLERLCEVPKHVFKDEQYDKERSELPEVVEDAVLKGLEASCSSKRKATDTKPVVKKKKAKLWVDDELDDLSSSDGENEESDSEDNKNSSSTKKNSDSDGSGSGESKKSVENGEDLNNEDGEESNSKMSGNLENDGTKNGESQDSEREKGETNETKEKVEDKRRDTEIQQNIKDT